jgi:hypothetical protein
MDHEPGWKASAFTPQMGELILDRIIAGETVREITADPRMPSYATVYRWTQVIPAFGEAWREARTRRARIEREAEAQEAEGLRAARAELARLQGKRPRDWVSGGKSTYTPGAAAAVCRAVEEGASLSEVVARPGMPSFKAIYRWLRRFPEFRQAYAEACDKREDRIVFQTQLIAEETNIVNFPQNRARVAAMTGRAGRMRPRKYRLRWACGRARRRRGSRRQESDMARGQARSGRRH